MNALTKSEVKTLAYLKLMFPGYAWGKTAGGGQLDFMGAPPADADLPMLFVESKVGADRVRESQNEWAKSDIGLRCRKFVVYSPSDDETTPCFLYTWDDFLTFVEGEDVVARIERKNAERRASTEMAPGNYSITSRGVDAHMRIDKDGTVIVLKDSKFRAQATPGAPERIVSRRNELLEKGTLVKDGDLLRLTQDKEFTSSSAAAGAVLGASASGPYEWEKSN